MQPEAKARKKIDTLLEKAGWVVQDYKELNLSAGFGIAAREFPTSNGPADYALYINKRIAGVIEAKPEGHTLGGVDWQSDKYIQGISESIPRITSIAPFIYETTGDEHQFRNLLDPEPRSRHVFAFHTPETLWNWSQDASTLRSRLKSMPAIDKTGLREIQALAIEKLEESLSNDRPRALIQMASGSGKTFTAVNSSYRLIKYAKAKRILFLVDRGNLGKQTKTEFEQFITPDDGRKFSELYNIQHLTTNTIDPVSKVCITTIQRLYSMLRGEKEFEEEREAESLNEIRLSDKEQEIDYNPEFPINMFDFVITDECHRSIYNVWRQVIEYFDAYLIGLTATPSKQTMGYFNQNLVMDYSHERAVADGINVGYDIYRIKTEVTEKGGKVESGWEIDKRDRRSRKIRHEKVDEDLEYEAGKLDRDVVATDQIRTVVKTFREKLPELFPKRTEVPKTLIFAKNDSHAEDIMHIVREEFGKGNDFCKKITYRSTGDTAENLIASFRNSYNPRIAVTVDMIATGTDIRPLECVFFMRDVRSTNYFDQMKGRGSRVISSDDLKSVTPDADYKSRFVLVDAVGVTENDKTDSRSLERKRSTPLKSLLSNMAQHVMDDDIITSLAGRLARLENKLTTREREDLAKESGNMSLNEIINTLLDVVDEDKIIDKAKELFHTKTPDDGSLSKAKEFLFDKSCMPFDNPMMREKLIELSSKDEQIIDYLTKDSVISTGYTLELAEQDVSKFRKFIEDNKDEILSYQILYNRSYKKRKVTYEVIKELANRLSSAPYNLSTERVWEAYKNVDLSKVRGNPVRVLTDIISLIRYEMHEDGELLPFKDIVSSKFELWLNSMKEQKVSFSEEQESWLRMIVDQFAVSVSVTNEDFQTSPFYEQGGMIRARKLFGKNLAHLIIDLEENLLS